MAKDPNASGFDKVSQLTRTLRQGLNWFQMNNAACQRYIGADIPDTLLRQTGSIAYFKLYCPLKQGLEWSLGKDVVRAIETV